jgi:hypothetical protein
MILFYFPYKTLVWSEYSKSCSRNFIFHDKKHFQAMKTGPWGLHSQNLSKVATLKNLNFKILRMKMLSSS